MDSRALGIEGEDLATRFLERQGLEIVRRNYRCRLGEIDVIARDGETLVFVEVRLRKDARFGGAAASISFHKQRRLLAAAGLYLSRLRRTPACRFDAVLLDRGGRIEWLRDVISA
jgi:putative endonuclease